MPTQEEISIELCKGSLRRVLASGVEREVHILCGDESKTKRAGSWPRTSYAQPDGRDWRDESASDGLGVIATCHFRLDLDRRWNCGARLSAMRERLLPLLLAHVDDVEDKTRESWNTRRENTENLRLWMDVRFGRLYP